jgi:hypothetical protein
MRADTIFFPLSEQWWASPGFIIGSVFRAWSSRLSENTCLPQIPHDNGQPWQLQRTCLLTRSRS